MAKRLAGEICGDHAVEENQKSMRMEVLVMAVEIELRRLEALKMAEDVDLGVICVIDGDDQLVKIWGQGERK